MKILSIDLGSYKTVLASSDTSAGDVILTESERRSTKMAIDYRNKIRQFGDVNITCKERNKVAENIRREIEEIAGIIQRNPLGKNILPSNSHIYALISNVISHYTKSRNVSMNELEVVVVVPSTYTQLHKNIIMRMVNMIYPKMGKECITDSVALSSYYLSKRSSENYKTVGFVDVGDEKSTVTVALINDTNIKILERKTVLVGGREITEHLLTKIYSNLDKKIPEIFNKDEFRVRNIKKIEWIKGAILGLPSISTQVDASYDKSVKITITQADIEEVKDKFTQFENILVETSSRLSRIISEYRMKQENTEEKYEIDEDIEVEVTGGSSKVSFIESMIHRAFNKKPEIHLNPNESIALGGVYKGLMESVFHRFRYDPFIVDFIDHPYSIVVSDGTGKNPRIIKVFEQKTNFLKEMKSKILSKKYDSKVILRHSPRKTVKISKISEDSKMIIYSGQYPVYALKLKKPAEAAQNKEEKAAHAQKKHEETAHAQTPNKPETDGKRPVKMIMKLTSTGDVEISSEDVEVVDVLDHLNFYEFKKTEDRQVQNEKLVHEIGGRVNTIQAAMFKSIDLLGGELSVLPSAEKAMTGLWEYAQKVDALASEAQTVEEVEAFSDKVEKELSVEEDWKVYSKKVTDEVAEKEGLNNLPIPAYPGTIFLYSPTEQAEQTARKEIALLKIQAEEAAEKEEAARQKKEEEDILQERSL